MEEKKEFKLATHPTMEEAIRLLITNGYIVTEPNTLSLHQRVEDLEKGMMANMASWNSIPKKDTPTISINALLVHIEDAITETESRSWHLREIVSGLVGNSHDIEPTPQGEDHPCSSLNDRLFAMLNKLSRANRRLNHSFECFEKGMFG